MKLARILQRTIVRPEELHTDLGQDWWEYQNWSQQLKSHPTIYNNNRLLIITHAWWLLQHMNCINDPVIIYCSRRNWFDQFLSFRYLNTLTKDDVSHIFTDTQLRKLGLAKFASDIALKKIFIEHSQIDDFIAMKLRWRKLYNEQDQFDTVEVSYEDFFSGIDIPILGITGLKFEPNDEVEQLPNNYKQNLFVNLEEAQEYFNQQMLKNHQ
jgi:hypothetical protein